MPAPKRVLERAQGSVEAGPLAVELVDEHETGQAELGCQVPDRFGLRFDALDRAHHDDSEVDDRQRRSHLAEEVGVAGRVDDVELDVAQRARCHGERQRHVPFDLFGLEVADGGAVVDLSLSGDGTGGEEQSLGQRGLARAVVSDQGDVADAGRWVTRHPVHLPPSRSFRRATACDRCGCEPTDNGFAQPGRPGAPIGPWGGCAGPGRGPVGGGDEEGTIEGARKGRWYDER